MDKKNAIENIFNRAAPTYNAVGPKFFSYFGEKLVKGACLVKGAKALDVAMGRGAVLFAVADAVGSDGQVTGIDISSSMVEETKKELLKRSLKNVSLARMDAENLEFPDKSFDNVLCGFGIFFCPDYCRALQEMHRVLKPNGGFAISTWAKSEDRRNWSRKRLKKRECL